MKLFVGLFVFAAANFSFAAGSCKSAVQEHFASGKQDKTHYRVESVVFQNKLGNADLLYSVRTTYFGGEAAWEAVTTPDCEVKSVTLIWAE